MHRVRPPNGRGRGLAQAEVGDLPLGDELGHGPDRLLDRHVGVDPVQVVELDAVDAEALSEASQASRAYSGRPFTAP